MSESVFSTRLRLVMEEKGMKQAELARLVGVGRSTINKYLRSSDKTHDALTVLKIAKALDVNSEWLYGATDIRKPFYEPSIVDIYGQLSEAGKKELYSYASYLLNKEKESVKELPHLGLTAAGAGVSGCDPFYETFKLRNVPKGADHILTVKGDSMEPLIKDGDIIFVAKTPIVENGEIAIVNMDGEITCKKFYMKNGVIELRSIKLTAEHCSKIKPPTSKKKAPLRRARPLYVCVLNLSILHHYSQYSPPPFHPHSFHPK